MKIIIQNKEDIAIGDVVHGENDFAVIRTGLGRLGNLITVKCGEHVRDYYWHVFKGCSLTRKDS